MSRLGIAFDSSARSTDAAGRLHIARSHISKATVNPYYGREIPGGEALGLDPNKVYQLLRDPAELAGSASTFERLPILRKHIPVSAEAPHANLVIGTIGSEVVFNDPYLDADLSFWDAEAIAGIETNTVRELSAAYYYVPVMTPGEFQGQPYDGVMTQIRGNHLALVESGRAGSDVLAADEAINPLALDEFKESDHPRAANGEFGSGGGGARGLVSVKVTSKRHPFVDTFLREHTSIAGQQKHLESVPTEKLHTALKLIEKSGDIEAGSTHVKKLIERELDSRANRGSSKGLGEDKRSIAADKAIKTMKTTKLGKALIVTLGGLSPKLAQDSAFSALVGQAQAKTFDKAAVSAKLIAMDSELDPKRFEPVIDSLLAMDAEEKEEKPKGAEDDDDETEEERKKRLAADEDDEEEEEKKRKVAQDAAIATAVDGVKRDLREADEARRAVRPVVGDVIAQDSAEGIYGFALDHMKVNREGVTGVPALKALFAVAQSKSAAPVVIAQDSAGLATRFPNAARFRQA